MNNRRTASIADITMSPSQIQARESENKKEFGLIEKTVWVLQEDIQTIDDLHSKAIKKYRSSINVFK